MESLSLSMVLSSSLLLQTHLRTKKPLSVIPTSIPSTSKLSHHLSSVKKIPIQQLDQTYPLLKNLTAAHLPLALTHFFLSTLPCLASESADPLSGKINLEAILVAIDDFFNRYPFFVAACTFIWLVVIPLAEEYLRKYKFISAIDAFRKLRDDPNAQLLDIRDGKSSSYLRSPNLKILEKIVIQVPYSEEEKEAFVNKVLDSLDGNAANTVLCILDNFDDYSMEVAELLFKNGCKEAYAIRGGVRGSKGWLAIQDGLLPPSVHMYPKKKVKPSKRFGRDTATEASSSTNGHLAESQTLDPQNINNYLESSKQSRSSDSRSSSPFPNYPDLKPPSSPSPSSNSK